MSIWSGARVVVTGAAGFVGAHLLERFAREGARVYGLVRPTSDRWRLRAGSAAELVSCELGDARAADETFARLAPDVVVHAAVERPPRDEAWHEVFASRSSALDWNVVCAARRVRARRVVWLTTQYEYPACASPAAEDDLRPPDTFYGTVKLASSMVARRFAAEVGMPLTCLRLFSVYGPLEGCGRFVQVAVRAALNGAVLPLTTADPVHDFVYIDDVARAVLLAAAHPAAPGRILNVATGTGTSNRGVVACLERLLGRPLETKTGAFPGSERDRAEWRADVREAEALLGFRASVPLEEGLARNLAWLRGRLAA